MNNNLTERFKRYGTALALFLYPLMAGFAFAAHPDLLSLKIDQDVLSKINEVHGNQLLHFGHALMLLATPLLVAIALHFMKCLKQRAAWWGWIGGMLAVFGALILAADKGALCLVMSAFDTLPEAEFQSLVPGITTMFHYRGWLWLLHLLPLLPLGFVIQAIALVRTRVVPRSQSVPILVGSLLMLNPDIDLIGLAATVALATGFMPYAMQLVAPEVPDRQPAVEMCQERGV